MSTADCKRYCADHYGNRYKERWPEIDASNPANWIRVGKYTVGSDIDISGGASYFSGLNIMQYRSSLKGLPARVMYLKGSDHATFVLVEKNGKVVWSEDCGD